MTTINAQNLSNGEMQMNLLIGVMYTSDVTVESLIEQIEEALLAVDEFSVVSVDVTGKEHKPTLFFIFKSVYNALDVLSSNTLLFIFPVRMLHALSCLDELLPSMILVILPLRSKNYFKNSDPGTTKDLQLFNYIYIHIIPFFPFI